ncbi:MAG: mechanosensitive ion channel family protein [Ilumatobacteraceae bacterium]
MFAVEWSQGIEDAWSDIASFVPKFFGFLVILIIGYFVAKLIAKAVGAILERVGFDKAVERGGVKKALERSKYDASDIVGKIVFYALFLLVLTMAFGVFGDNPISEMLAGVIAYLPKVLAAILIVVIASAIGAAAREMIDASVGQLSYGTTLANGVGAAILVIGVFAALNQLEIAPEIVTGLFYALLAIVVGVTVIAVGGGGVGPMRSRWDNALAKYDEEKPKVQEASKGAKDRIADRARERAQQAKPDEDTALPPPGTAHGATGRR